MKPRSQRRPVSGRIAIGLTFVSFASCTDRPSESARSAAEPSCTDPPIREVVELFGERLKQVSLLAPDSLLAVDIRHAYGPLVTDSLLDAWIDEPSGAPGREESSPWPDRIEIRSIEPAEDGLCGVDGEIVYVTSVPNVETKRMPVMLHVTKDEPWRIADYTAEANSRVTAAEDVLRRYYAAINARDFRQAYELWEGGGAASGQEYDAFAEGFEETERVEVEIMEPGRIEGAAGSQYVRIPVVIRAVTRSGNEQQFEGTYVVRRAMIEGATAEPRNWHIYDASIAPVK